MLKPGGIIHLDAPFMQAFHLDPVDYWHFTIDGLRQLCRDFNELEAGVQVGPSCGVYWILREYMDSCFTNNRYMARSLLILTAFLLAPMHILTTGPGGSRRVSRLRPRSHRGAKR